MATGSVGGNDPVVDRQVLETGWPGRLHGLALRTYPRRFRARFGAALRYDFAQAMADALRRGTVQKYAVALSWSLDALVSGFMERVGLGGGGISMNEAVENDGTRGRSGGNGAGRDVRLAVRRLSRQPGLAAVVILTLGLAIGASSVVFLAMDALFLRPLVYPEAEHLYRLEAGAAGRFDPRISIEDAEDVARLARSVDAIAMIDFGTVSLADGNGPADVVTSAHASASVFDVLGMGPSIGRGFAAGEDAIGRGEVVVLSDGYWRRRFAAQADVVGRTVRIQGVERTIVGVLPPHFEDPATGEQGYADVWLPLAVDESLRSRGTRWARAIARLSPAASREEAAAEVTAIAVRLAEAYPETNEGQALRLVSLRLKQVCCDLDHIFLSDLLLK